MLSADVRFEGFTQSDWSRVLSLFRPRPTSGVERDPDRPQGGLIAVHGEGRLRKLIHTQAGRVRLDDVAHDWPMSAEELARRHNASWAILLELGALETVMDRFGAKVRRTDDLTAQVILLVSLARDETISGRLQYWPARLAGMPIPTTGMVSGTLDAVCPRGQSIVLGLFEAGELWTCIAVRRGHSGSFDWVLGPDEIRRDMGLLAGDWRRDYRHLARAIERKVGKLSMGVFAEATTFKQLEVDPSPGAWARAVGIRDVILSPVPLALAIPLGIDAGRAALSAIRGIAERMDGLGIVSPLFGAMKDTLTQVAHAAGMETHDGGLGFDPLELVRRLLSRER